MRAVIQRVSSAQVSVDGRRISQIDRGLLVLLGVEKRDTDADAVSLAAKTVGLRIFDDAQGKMNLCLAEIKGQLLVVSQFTLLGDARKGRRPSFINAAEPEQGNRLYELFVSSARKQGIEVFTGQFRAEMQVQLVNDGPVTILLDSGKIF